MNATDQGVTDAWNMVADQAGLAKIRFMTRTRTLHLHARIAEAGIPAIYEAICRVGESAFCCGDNDRGWKADFDFILQPKSFVKLLEGHYCDKLRREKFRNGALEILAREAAAEARGTITIEAVAERQLSLLSLAGDD